jgi:hypothetical protein
MLLTLNRVQEIRTSTKNNFTHTPNLTMDSVINSPNFTLDSVAHSPNDYTYPNSKTKKSLTAGLCLAGSLTGSFVDMNMPQEHVITKPTAKIINIGINTEIFNSPISSFYVLNKPQKQYTELNDGISGIFEGEDTMVMRRKSQKVNPKMVSSTFVLSGRHVKSPRLDMIENDDIRDKKRSYTEVNVPMSLEYAGRLPKRPRI